MPDEQKSSGQKSSVEQAIDLFVYAPIGLALTAKEEFPKLIEKGRQRLTSQLTMARFIGQFAVTQGQKEAEKAAVQLAQQVGTVAERLSALNSIPGPTGGAVRAVARDTAPEARFGANGSNGSIVGRPAVNGTPATAGPPAAPRVGPDAGTLAIPGYDSLSASQVVQRLDGLSPEELNAVGRYEDAHRGRRTILSKVTQLQAGGS
jgi:hypothetical protein